MSATNAHGTCPDWQCYHWRCDTAILAAMFVCDLPRAFQKGYQEKACDVVKRRFSVNMLIEEKCKDEPARHWP